MELPPARVPKTEQNEIKFLRKLPDSACYVYGDFHSILIV